MADNPQRPAATTRPLSPHLTIYRWPATMLTSITHRVTGVGLSLGAIVLAWWLVSVSNGPEGWQAFHAISDTPIGALVLGTDLVAGLSLSQWRATSGLGSGLWL